MKACLYSPYLPQHLGGGEKYLLDVALELAQRHSVCIAVPAQYAGDASIVKKYENFLEKSLAKIRFVPSPLGSKASFLKKLWWTRQFDLFYYLTDGSLFFSLAKQNILHVQFPLRLDKSSWLERLKLRNWQVKNTNSRFTKNIIEPSWPVEVDLVHWPAVEVEALARVAKKTAQEKVILSVGRFFRHLHSKRQDILIDIFRQLKKEQPQLMKDWKLVLIGSVEDDDYLTHLKRKKRGLPIEFYHDLSRAELREWYARASFYWHAAGFGINPKQHPEKAEHFGISTAEAMASGTVPLVHNKGGQPEVLGYKLRNLLWLKQDECVKKTIDLIKNQAQYKEYQQQVTKRAQVFSQAEFARKLRSMIEDES